MIREFLPEDAVMLRQVAMLVNDFSDPGFIQVVRDMFETMRAGNGVGLAAPQIGVPFRIIVLEFPKSDRMPDEPAVPATVLVNPVIISGIGAVDGTEGCFSVPGRIGTISRYEEIDYLAQNEQGIKTRGRARGFHARIIQHEVDHLNGILYTDKAKDLRPYQRDPV